MRLQDNEVIQSLELFLINALAVGIAVKLLEKETLYSKEEWQVFLQRNAQEQYNSMSQSERILFVKLFIENSNKNHESN